MVEEGIFHEEFLSEIGQLQNRKRGKLDLHPLIVDHYK